MSDAVPEKPIRRPTRKRTVAKAVAQPETTAGDTSDTTKPAVRKRARRRDWRGDPRDTKDAAQELSLEAIATLGDIAADDGASPSARVAAATAILDRAFGRPTAGQEESGRTDLASFLASLGDGANDPSAPPPHPAGAVAAGAPAADGEAVAEAQGTASAKPVTIRTETGRTG